MGLSIKDARAVIDRLEYRLEAIGRRLWYGPQSKSLKLDFGPGSAIRSIILVKIAELPTDIDEAVAEVEVRLAIHLISTQTH